MNRLRKVFFTAAWLAAVAAQAQMPAQAQTPVPLRIGVTAGVAAESIEAAAAEARKQGLDVKVVEFADYTTPNVAVDAGDLDANYFQHQAFLDNAIKQRGYKLRSVAIGVVSNLGLYSTRFRQIEALPDGARIALANDASNQARSLGLLAQAGLIQLRKDAGPFPTLDDITVNPKKLRFLEVEYIQIVRSLDDVDAGVLLPHALVRSGKKELATQALFYDKGDPRYWAVQFVARSDKPEDPRLRRFIQIYRDAPGVREAIRTAYAGSDKLYNLPWLEAQK